MLELILGKLYRTKAQVYLFHRDHTQTYNSIYIRPGEIILLVKKPEPMPDSNYQVRGGLWLYKEKILINSVTTNNEPEIYFELLEGQEE